MRCVVVGASAAGISCAKTLRKLNKDVEITLISKDEHVVSRCILHHYIEDVRSIDDLNFAPYDFFKVYGVEWIKGREVIKIDPKGHKLSLDNGEEVEYDKVCLAPGSSSFIPPIENLREAKNVVGLRNLEDAILIKDLLPNIKDVIVLGGGLVGIDAIAGLLKYDVKIHLVEMGDRILPLQLDHYAADAYNKRLEERGVDLRFGVRAEKLIVDEDNKPKELELNTGEKVPCDLVIVATGVRSNVGFIKDAGIDCDKFGLVINEKGETDTKDVYGAGDVTGRNPIWPTAVKEGIIAASNMLGRELFMTDFFGSKNTMNICNLATMSLGTVIKPDDSYEEVIDVEGEDYKKIIHKEGKIYGAIIQGDLSYAGVLTQLIKEKIDVSRVKKPLFDIDYADFFNIKENLEFTY